MSVNRWAPLRDLVHDARGRALAVATCLVGYLLVTQRSALTFPFVNDDFVILDKAARSSFFDLWRFREPLFDWYRPWSREFHYWVLLHLAGLDPIVYHCVSFALWLGMAVLYFDLACRITGTRVAAAISTAGIAALALWGTPLLWIAGVQDLWMLVLGLLFLQAIARGRTRWAYPALLLALLSKETAAVLPAIAFGYFLWIERVPWRAAVRRASGFTVLVGAWVVLHPTLHGRLFGSVQRSLEAQTRPSLGATILRTLLAQVNLDAWPAPQTHWREFLLPVCIGSAALVTVVLLSRRADATRAERPGGARPARQVVVFGGLWAFLGWAILLLPSIGWHAYYGSLGSLGFWLIPGAVLARHHRAAIALVVGLVVISEARMSTPSWDWGTRWYMQRAGNFLGGIRQRLLELHPVLPGGSRLYFAAVPNNIGFLAGDGPGLRVWYRDPSLRARFLSDYRLRAPADSAGRDYFFRFDLRDTLVELVLGPESTFTADRFTPAWRHDQSVLASALLKAGNVAAAAGTYAKLWAAFPARSSYALYAAAAYDAAGDRALAPLWYRTAREALGDSAVSALAPGLVLQAQALAARGRERALASPSPIGGRGGPE